jgi:guanine nucleotide-binding protein G(i) subunit alpha
MGSLLSKKDEEKLSDAINRRLHDDGKKLKNEVKLLLLGTGESGKSTFAKQLKILHMSGFTKEELMHYKSVLHSNVLVGIATLIDMAPKLGYTINPALQGKLDAFSEPNIANMPLTPELAADIKAIWPDPAIQQTYERRAEFQLHGSVPYIVANIDRIADPNSLPVDDDVIQCRVRTTGIVELLFELEHINFRVIDVGGQRSERRKWIHCFEGVTAVIFCVAMSEYDEKLCEDTKVNRMHEALELFEEICNNHYFRDSAMVLFLNKKDLFADKINKVDLRVCFPQYDGGQEFDTAAGYIERQFLEKSHDKDKLIYTHITCATDTENVRVVFDAVRASVLQSNLKQLQL